ncbi:MAG: glycosyltransferase family 2 protein [Rhodospirillales bacterium]|nr:glycosyltransferase family 2 protein [Rhodospirillales bacterium]
MPPESLVSDGLADVSAIMPAWRAARTIGRALASIAAQTVPPREVIVADDGSDDGTVEAAERVAKAFSRTRFILLRMPHQGAGAARNAAVQAACGTFVAFLDADDEWLPAKIERSLAHAADVVLVSHNYIAVAGGRKTVGDCARHFRAARDPALALFERNFIATSTVMARREAVLTAGGFDPGLSSAQDYDLWLAMVFCPGARFRVFAEDLACCHLTPGSITSQVGERRRCSMAVLERHAPGLKGRTSVPHAVALTRAAIVHYEAAGAFLGRGMPLSAGRAALRLPAALAAAWRAVSRPSQPRPHFYAAAPDQFTEP